MEQPLADHANESVSRVMSQSVIDILELVEIEKEKKTGVIVGMLCCQRFSSRITKLRRLGSSVSES